MHDRTPKHQHAHSKINLQNVTRCLFGAGLIVALVLLVTCAIVYGIDFEKAIYAVLVILLIVGTAYLGKDKEEKMAACAQKLVSKCLSTPARALASIALTLILVAWLGYAVIASEVIEVVPMLNIEIEVLENSKGSLESLGYATKDKPYSDRFLRPLFGGDRTFVFRASGLKEQSNAVRIGYHFPWPKPAPHRIDVPIIVVPDITVSDLTVDQFTTDRFENAPESLKGKLNVPVQLRRTPSRAVYFALSSVCPLQVDVTGVILKITSAQPQMAWAFPYYGEPKAYRAAEVNSFVELRPDMLEAVPHWPTTQAVGKGLTAAQYALQLFSKRGFTYNLQLKVMWNETFDKGNAGILEPQGATCIVDFPRDWRELVTNRSVLRFIYYCAADELIQSLDEIDCTAQFQRLLLPIPM